MLFSSLRSLLLPFLMPLVACGGDDGAPVTATAAPTPVPSPAVVTASPAPAPSPAPVAAVEPYAIGSLTYSLAADIPADKVAGIRDAMDFVVAHSNAIAAFTGTIPVVYGAGTPTADASYQGQIRFGGSIGRRVALHELAHWLGSGSAAPWNGLVKDGRFTGMLTNARLRALDGDAAVLSVDGQHFWPYGLNYDREFHETQRNTQLVSAQRADMGLAADATAAIAGMRRFQNRSSEHVLQGAASGSAPVGAANATGPAQQWRVGFDNGFVTLVNNGSGLALAAAGPAGDDAPTTMAAVADTRFQQWEMMPVGEPSWFLLRNRQTGTCLDTIGNSAAGAPLRLWSCGFHPNQQWRLVR